MLSFLAKEQILSSEIDCSKYSTDASLYDIKPELIVLPSSAMDIKLLFEFCRRENKYLTFRAAGTSLSGQALTDGILCDISQKFRNLIITHEGRKVTVEPGVRGGYINKLLAKYGRILGPDPASIENCMVGGMVANNSSGMSSGIHSNPFQTVESLKLVFPSGLMLDTASEQSREKFRKDAAEIIEEIIKLKDEVRANETAKQKILRKYEIKNTIGYAMNAFLEVDDPIDIIQKLIIGSEGTIAFVEEATFRTIRSYSHKHTGFLCFESPKEACKAIAPFKSSGAKVIEIIDYNCLKSVSHNDFLKNIFAELPPNAASILFEYQEDNENELRKKIEISNKTIKDLNLIAKPLIAENDSVRNQIWDIRKGLLASIGGSLDPGETVVIEDVAFRLEDLPKAINDLNELFRKFEYSKSGVYGHGIDGNLHFLISQNFSSGVERRRFAQFLEELYELVVIKYDGSLKAEHGTGRNMAPYVEKEWGSEIYEMMKRIKKIFDPHNILNPGVLINEDTSIHIKNLKETPSLSSEFDSCIECGFCERVCPSRDLSFTPRQRIKMLRALENKVDKKNHELIYKMLDTCAVDGLCEMACPISINTGEIVKSLRNQTNRRSNKEMADMIAGNFEITQNAAKASLTLGHAVEALSWTNASKQLSRGIELLFKTTLPKFNPHLPGVSTYTSINHKYPDFLYFPCCVSRIMGKPKRQDKNLIDTIISLSDKAGYKVNVPQEANDLCCGNAFLSKGYFDAYSKSLKKYIDTMYHLSNEGEIPIFLDTSSCTHSLQHAEEYLDSESRAKYDKMIFMDIVDFLHDKVLSNLRIKKSKSKIALHPNCSVRKMGSDRKLIALAESVADTVIVPDNLDCCGFAGDRGLLFPELTIHATRNEAKEIKEIEADEHYSSNIPCEVAMSDSVKSDYVSIAYLLDQCS